MPAGLILRKIDYYDQVIHTLMYWEIMQFGSLTDSSSTLYLHNVFKYHCPDYLDYFRVVVIERVCQLNILIHRCSLLLLVPSMLNRIAGI